MERGFPATLSNIQICSGVNERIKHLRIVHNGIMQRGETGSILRVHIGASVHKRRDHFGVGVGTRSEMQRDEAIRLALQRPDAGLKDPNPRRGGGSTRIFALTSAPARIAASISAHEPVAQSSLNSVSFIFESLLRSRASFRPSDGRRMQQRLPQVFGEIRTEKKPRA